MYRVTAVTARNITTEFTQQTHTPVEWQQCCAVSQQNYILNQRLCAKSSFSCRNKKYLRRISFDPYGNNSISKLPEGIKIYNKVEICGVNTSSLKVLTEEQKETLLARAKQGDKTARDELVNGNLKLVLSVIQRFTGRGENPDDLFQVGCIGLIKAIDNFDPVHEVKFSTYAVPMIIGEIRRYLRDNNSVRVSRSIKDTAYRAMQIKERLTNLHQREPTVDEIAAELGISREETVIALESTVDPISLNEPMYNDGGDTIYVMDQVGDGNDDRNWLEEIAFKQAISELSEREKRILTMRFMMGRTQMEVASEIGISQAQVSRLEKSALDRIKNQI